jgi:A1 cistron-splicing factor AAR2
MLAQQGLGAVLGIVGLPSGYNIGMNMRMWEVGEKFTGIRGISPGVHFVYYSSYDDEIRQSFFITIDGSNPMFVYEWSKQNECLELVQATERYSHLRSFFLNDFRYISGLAPFDSCIDEQSSKNWLSASRYISTDVIARIQPINGLPFGSSQQPSGDLPKSSVPSIFFTEVGKVQLPPGSSGSAITQSRMDSSLHLRQFLARVNNRAELDVIGELQAAFILFLLGTNYEAFVQWRKMLEVFLKCKEEGIRARSDLFVALSDALKFQVEQLPDDFMLDPGMSDDEAPHRPGKQDVFILHLLSEFVVTCSDDSLVNEIELQRNVQELDRILAQKYGEEWTGVFDPDQDSHPVVVSL